MPLLYLDVCCLNRPFDDRTQPRIRLETEASLAILQRCQRGEWQLVSSEVIDLEVAKIPDGDRRKRVESWVAIAQSQTVIDDSLSQRAIE